MQRNSHDEDDETYGFGSFSDLFDVGAARTTARLNCEALSRICMPVSLLTRFQQQQDNETTSCFMFQHVAAKLDGVSIDGGLGTLGVTSMEGGGIVWLQTMLSDSNAQERRRQELEHVTYAHHKSAAALFLSFSHVSDVRSTVVQNTVQGVELQLMDGARFELIFMPGEACLMA